MTHGGGEQVGLVREVVQERAERDASATGDLGGRGTPEAEVHEALDGRLQQRGLRVLATFGLGSSRPLGHGFIVAHLQETVKVSCKWGVALLLLSGLLASCARGPEGTRDALRAEVDAVAGESRFRFDYRATGTRVPDCFLPYREFAISVDLTGAGALEARHPDGSLIAVRAGDWLYVSGAALDNALGGAWIRLRPDASDERASAVRRALGADLSGYVMSSDFPAPPAETVQAVLDIATDVQRLEDGTFRITADAAKLAAAAPLPSDSDDPSPGGEAPVVDVVIAESAITRIVVQAGTSSTDGEPSSSGWAADYGPPPDADVAMAPDVFRHIADVPIEQLRARPVASCEL